MGIVASSRSVRLKRLEEKGFSPGGEPEAVESARRGPLWWPCPAGAKGSPRGRAAGGAAVVNTGRRKDGGRAGAGSCPETAPHVYMYIYICIYIYMHLLKLSAREDERRKCCPAMLEGLGVGFRCQPGRAGGTRPDRNRDPPGYPIRVPPPLSPAAGCLLAPRAFVQQNTVKFPPYLMLGNVAA